MTSPRHCTPETKGGPKGEADEDTVKEKECPLVGHDGVDSDNRRQNEVGVNLIKKALRF